MLNIKPFLSLLIGFSFLASDPIPVATSPEPTSSISSIQISSYLDSAVHLARLYRHDPKLSVADNTDHKHSILKQLSLVLPVYQTDESLEDLASRFFEDFVQSGISKYTLINSSKTDLGGKSKDVVIFVKDAANQLCFVIKLFQHPFELAGKFLPELSGMDLLINLNLRGVRPVYPLAVAQGHYKGKVYGLLIETAGAGQRMDQYLYQLAKQKDIFLHQESLQIAVKAFKRMGESLARLHALKSDVPSALAESAQITMEDRINEVFRNPFILEILSRKINITDLVDCLEKVKQEAIDVPIYPSHAHADAHLGNMTYDKDADEFSFIDLSRVHRSVDSEGNPLLSAFVDIIRPEQNLLKKGLTILSQEEIETLSETYYEGYQTVAGEVDPRLLTFFKTSEKLKSLIHYIRYLYQVNPILRAQEEALFEDALVYCQDLIDTFKQHESSLL